MAQRRRYGEDLAYAEWHRLALEQFYERIGHRLHFGDRDWTEICGFCREPLALFEEVMDRGQNLNEKAVTWTRALADKARMPAYLIAPRVVRPPEVEREIEQLQARVIELQTSHPIDRFTVKTIWPHHGQLTAFSPRDWAEHVLMIHADHWSQCATAKRHGPRVDRAKLLANLNHSRLFTPNGQMRLILPSEAA